MVDRDVVAVAPALVEPERGVVDAPRAQASADHGHDRRRHRRALHRRDLGPDRVAGDHRARQRRARERHRGAGTAGGRRCGWRARDARRPRARPPGCAGAAPATSAGQRRVAADADDHVRPGPAHDPRWRGPTPPRCPRRCGGCGSSLGGCGRGRSPDPAAGRSRSRPRGPRSTSSPRCAPTKRIESRGWPRATSSSASASAGYTCPPVPPPVTSAKVALAARTGVGRICRPTLASTPAANIVVTSAVPPNDTNGSGMPVTGSSPTTAPMLMTAWPTIHTVMPAASSTPNRSGARNAARMPRTREADEERDHEQPADQAELLADDREDEVGVRVREEVPFGPARAEADAGQPAAADRDERLRDLVPRVGLVGERMQEREEARPPVRLGDARGC